MNEQTRKNSGIDEQRKNQIAKPAAFFKKNIEKNHRKNIPLYSEMREFNHTVLSSLTNGFSVKSSHSFLSFFIPNFYCNLND